MEDKVFEFMTKMYSDLTTRLDGLDSKLGDIDNRFDEMDTKIGSISNGVIRIENDLGSKVNAALDGYKQVFEKLTEHDMRFDSIDNRFDALEGKVQKQDVEIRVIKGGIIK